MATDSVITKNHHLVAKEWAEYKSARARVFRPQTIQALAQHEKATLFTRKADVMLP